MLATFSTDEQITRRLQAVDYSAWRNKVESVGGCAFPVRLSGSWEVRHAVTGHELASRSGHVFAPCGNRRAAVCLACSHRYAADAFHLIRAGLAGGSKNVPVAVAERPRVFATLTAPSFGAIHNRRISARGKTMPCPCGDWHHPDDPRLGTPLDPEGYDYVGTVLWQAHAGALWHRFRITLRRQLAHLAGLTTRQFDRHARVEYGKVAEYQRRGLVHFHAVIRVDGPDGPASPAPAWATTELLTDAIRAATAAVALAIDRPDGTRLELVWGDQVDVRHIRPTEAAAVQDADGHISDQRLAAYVAKYATKGTGTSEAADRRIHSQRHLDALTLSTHHRRIMQTAWDLGDHPEYAELNLRKWAHMLGFRGHFLTKSKRYSTTFRALHDEQRIWRTAEALDGLGVTEDQVLVVTEWHFGGIGYLSDGERELAHGIAQRLAQTRSNAKRRDAA